ncbi:hypothetical protein PVAND_005504 [Polypedilum vanderplanki]|uniref:Reverse transcriptase domain-containing protein n=1 Tax=Polypedilum vanderplanki TaxID=319348 RepID=A0A9J6C191_POLVA|nr:hypothetical protein PVAND_005504 [Polypedilum vanderplanki]
MALKLMSWNCQSVSRKKAELSHFLLDHNIDIALLSETWLNDEATYSIPGFNTFTVCRQHGGVMILTKDSITVNGVNRIALSYAEAISINIPSAIGTISVTSIYCSPASSRSQASEFFRRVLDFPGSVVIAGDFNAKHSSWNNSSDTLKGKDLFGLCRHGNYTIHPPDGPTLYSSRGTLSVVDFVISKALPGVNGPKVINELSSDHLPLTFSIPVASSQVSQHTFFHWPKANWKKFRAQLNCKVPELASLDLSSCDAIDCAIDAVTVAINDAASSSIPRKAPYRFRFPFSDHLHRLTRERNRYRQQFRATQRPEFRSLVNQLNRLIKDETTKLSQASFDSKLSQLYTQDCSAFRFIKAIKNKRNGFSPLLNPATNQLVYTDSAKASVLSDSFLTNHCITTSWLSNKDALVSNVVNTFRRSQIAVSESITDHESLTLIIKSLRVRKAEGLDGIATRFLKNLPKSLLKVVTMIFNQSYKLGYFPSAWKRAKVIAIPKKDKPTDKPSNFRPISLLSTLGKLYEKVILDKVSRFEEANELIKPQQFGFRSRHSTTHQVLRIIEEATIGFNNKKSTGIVLLDLEKAFDTVWHEGLIYKLIKLKFPPEQIRVIDSFLTGRQASVYVNGHASPFFTLPAGVPQGSTLSPFLFNVFINDIPRLKHCKLAQFADDTALYTVNSWKNLGLIKTRLLGDLSTLASFYRDWKVKMNDSKTEFSIFTRSYNMRRKAEADTISFGTNTYKWQKEVRYLGVTLDTRLSFQAHIKSVLAKASGVGRSIYCIFKKHNTVPIRTKINLYKVCIRPLLTYAAPVFANCPVTYSRKLQITQNKFLRMCLNASYYTRTADLHEEGQVPLISDFIKKLTTNFYDRANNHTNSLICALGNYSSRLRGRRIRHKLPRP